MNYVRNLLNNLKNKQLLFYQKNNLLFLPNKYHFAPFLYIYNELSFIIISFSNFPISESIN